ncbi:MAG: hypothetical protein ACLPQS_09585 [Acidimicrobiales bacterium]
MPLRLDLDVLEHRRLGALGAETGLVESWYLPLTLLAGHPRNRIDSTMPSD